MYTYSRTYTETELLLWGGGLGSRTESGTLSNHSLETLLDRLDRTFAKKIFEKFSEFFFIEIFNLIFSLIFSYSRLALVAEEEVEAVALVEGRLGRVTRLAPHKVLDVRS